VSSESASTDQAGLEALWIMKFFYL
jgi:hypothetical protein